MIPAPPWAFSAEAIDGDGDTHLVPGTHVRCLPAPSVGLPATPLFVYRAVVKGRLLETLGNRTEVTWIDSHGTVLTAPFTVQPDNPVTGRLPGGLAVWALLSAVEEGGLTFSALANGPLGELPFAERTGAPFAVAGQRIDAVRVSGNGRVLGLRWMARDGAVNQSEPKLTMIWSLPVDPAPRYRPTPDARAEAKERVERGAPLRLPQYGVLGQNDPASSPPAGPGFSLTRLELLEPELDRWLDRLLNDLSEPTFDLRDEQGFDDAPGSVSLLVEPHLLGASLDPDLGHWLGFGDVDRDPDATKGSVALYLIRGLWRFDPKRWSPRQAAALRSRVVASPDQAAERFPDLSEHGLLPDQEGPFLDLTALATAAVGAPPLRPGTPALVGFEDRNWLPEPPPPGVRRHVRLRLGGLGPRSLLAAVADDGRLRVLNSVIGEGRPEPGETPEPERLLGMSVAEPPDATGPGQTRIDDRDAGEGGAGYRVAQGDWFGRWGEWADHTAPDKARTAPHAPAVELTCLPPAFSPGGPVPDGPLAGTVTVRVAIPRTADLPPGGFPLHRLRIDHRVGGGAIVTTTLVLGAPGTVVEPHPAPEHDVLVLTQPGPPLGRAESTTLEVTGRWIDQGGLTSPESEPAHRVIFDPRPPPLPVVPTELRYSARPDATGFARVELSWPSVPGRRYRVFASTETTLLGALRAGGQAAVADAIAATPAGAPRAMALQAERARFSWDAFECVTGSPLVATGTTTTFVHRVSGSLDVLAVYRVLPEGPSGVLAEITAAGIVPVAVPNLGPPPPPLASLAPIPHGHDPAAEGCVLKVLVPPGRAVPETWQVRRATLAASDPLRMGVVASGPIPPGSTSAEGTRFEIPLAGPLRQWRQYRFVVEVQAGPPPGAPTVGEIPAGEWSAPSAPVTLATIPAETPSPPSAVEAIVQQNGNVLLRVDHPQADALVGTPFGSYRFEVYRLAPGERPVRTDLDPRRSAGNLFEAVDPAPPDSSAWTVRLVDPIGRVSDQVTAVRL